jgi:hypothetical protein
MKLFEKSNYTNLDVVKEFNKIILSELPNYDGKKKEQLKSYLEDTQKGGCMSGMVSEFIYHADCKEFYIKHIDDLEEIKTDLEDSIGEPIKNRHELPHYTFICWLAFEEYCYNLYTNIFEN